MKHCIIVDNKINVGRRAICMVNLRQTDDEFRQRLCFNKSHACNLVRKPKLIAKHVKICNWFQILTTVEETYTDVGRIRRNNKAIARNHLMPGTDRPVDGVDCLRRALPTGLSFAHGSVRLIALPVTDSSFKIWTAAHDTNDQAYLYFINYIMSRVLKLMH